MKNDYKEGDKVLVEATIGSISPSGFSGIKLAMGNGRFAEFYCEPLSIYSHVPAIKPGTRVDVSNDGEAWREKSVDKCLYYFVGTNRFAKQI